MAMLWTGAMAQSDCTNVIISMSPCLNYITGNSSAPTSGCCTQLGSVVRSRPECLCQVLNGGGSSLGLDVNQTQAEALPGSCKVQTPPLSSSNMYPSQPLTASSPNGSPAGKSDSPTKVPSGTKNCLLLLLHYTTLHRFKLLYLLKSSISLCIRL